ISGRMAMTRIIEIVGQGFSIRNYRHIPGAIVWSINAMQFALPKAGVKVDQRFWMDDPDIIRKVAPGYYAEILAARDDVITTRTIGFSPFMAYPLREVLCSYGMPPYFNCTPAYAIAYAGLFE